MAQMLSLVVDVTDKDIEYYQHDGKLYRIMKRELVNEELICFHMCYSLEVEMRLATPKERFYFKCTKHDWWYMMSDDPRVYNKGKSAAAKLEAERDSKGYQDIYNEVCPYGK